jgi:hypothetical protein
VLAAKLLGEHGAHSDASLVGGSREVGLSLLSAGAAHVWKFEIINTPVRNALNNKSKGKTQELGMVQRYGEDAKVTTLAYQTTSKIEYSAIMQPLKQKVVE